MPGQDGTDGGYSVDSSVSVIETTTTDQDAYILVQSFSVIRGEPVVYEGGDESVYTPSESAVGMDIIAVGENGQNGGDAYEDPGGSGGIGAEIRGRIPFEVESEYTIAPATLDPAGNGGAGYRDGGRGGNSSGVVRRSDGKRLLTAGGGGGGGGAGRWYSYQGEYYTYYEWVGGGGGGGGPNGSGGSGHTGSSSWNVDETPESDPGQDGSGSGSTGGNGGDGGYANAGSDGTDGSTYAAESVDVTQQTTNDEAAYVQVVPLYNPVTEPENVSASAAGETSVSLSYDLPDGAEGANIYRGTSGDVDSLTPIDSVDAGAAPYLDEGLEKGTEYFYAVTSTVSTYESVKSEIVSVTLSKPVKVWTGTEWASGEMKIFDGQDWAAMSGLSVAGASDWNQLN
ncbi:hypothetical protein ACFQDD_00645 [Halorubrum pallidum]|uniref:Fibronectin type-III domain-containing protein n=1 Tax=Halorubrum pallidum TaxID=1526114 RepID=A0ABD5SYA3_9EURY